MRNPIAARAFCRQSDLSRSAHAVDLAKHLIPCEVGPFKHDFLKRTARRTNDDLNEVSPCHAHKFCLIPGWQDGLLCILDATVVASMGQRVKNAQKTLCLVSFATDID